MFSQMMQFQAKLFSYLNSTLSKEEKAFTPFRSNLIALNKTMNSLESFEVEKKTRVETFINNFWFQCMCKSACHMKVSLNEALEIHESYSTMTRKLKAISLGAVIKNFKCEVEFAHRQVFSYNISGG